MWVRQDKVWFNKKEKNMPLSTYNEYVKDIISIDKGSANEQRAK